MENEKQAVIDCLKSKDPHQKIPEGMDIGRFLQLFVEICEEASKNKSEQERTAH